jgi:DNA-binding NtrC family response regulator
MSIPDPSLVREAAVHVPAAGETNHIERVPPLDSLESDWPSLSLLSRRYIDRALSHTQGNKTRAADMLGIDRRTLNRILVRDRAKKSKPTLRGVSAT